MLARLFESKARKAADMAELDRLERKFGEQLVPELRARVVRSQQDPRSREHWQRLLSKAK